MNDLFEKASEKASDEEIERRVAKLASRKFSEEDEDVINLLEVEPILSDRDVAEAVDFSALLGEAPTDEGYTSFAEFIAKVATFYEDAYGCLPPFLDDTALSHEAQLWYESSYINRVTASSSGESGYLALRDHLVEFQASRTRGIQIVDPLVHTSFARPEGPTLVKLEEDVAQD